METIGPVVALAVGVLLFIAAARRRARMTPEERALQDQAFELRRLRREIERRRYD